MTRSPALLVASAGLAAVVLACVLPDRFIVIVDENVQNKHPVRFVDPTPVTNEAANECLAQLIDEERPTALCQPSEPSDALPLFLDPALAEDMQTPYRFCSCDAQESDTVPLQAATLYVEDRANDVDEGLDPIYAALQLDLRPDEAEPQRTVAYIGHVDPSAPLEEAPEIEYVPPRRPNEAAGRALRKVTLGTTEKKIDLCNGASATPLAQGFHTLRLIVTDAPWFTPAPAEKDDSTVQQFGVPDLTNGATYDSITYIFHCDDKASSSHCEERCGTLE